jgi:AraC-like DNA-binding protein
MTRSSYTEFAPPPDLRSTVACTWIARTASDTQAPAPIIPDACSDVVIVGDAAPHVAGPATRTQHVLVPAGTTVVGIRFRPGATRAVFACDASELRDADPELAAVCGSAERAFAESLRRVHDTDPPSGLRGALESWARTRLVARIDRDADALRAAHRLVIDRRATVRDVARAFGWSERRLHREITTTCGYGPKTLQRIVRLQRALRANRAGVATRPPTLAPTLSRLAFDAGYADQAHMTREFRDLTGFTPRQLLGRSGADVGRWLDA